MKRPIAVVHGRAGLFAAWLLAATSGTASRAHADDGSGQAGTGHILGGQPISVGEFPTVVAVVNHGICTGTLIHPEWVVTAAHCVSTEDIGGTQAELTANTTVVFDSIFANSGGRRIPAADTIPHPSFAASGLGDNDLGLIRLSQPVTPASPSHLTSHALWTGLDSADQSAIP